MMLWKGDLQPKGAVAQHSGKFSSQPGAGLLGCDPALKEKLYARAPQGMPQTRPEIMRNVRPVESIMSKLKLPVLAYKIKNLVPRAIRSPVANFLTMVNSLEMTLVELGLKKQADAIFQDGARLPGVSRDDLGRFRTVRYLKRLGIPWDYQQETVEFFFKGRPLSLKHADEGFGAIAEVFFRQDYGRLEVAGKDVLDLGANVGDSTIFFRLKGAERVIGVEPFPYMHAIAVVNVVKNRMDGISLLNAGIAAESGEITIDPKYISNGGSQLKAFASGEKVKLYTLADLVEKYCLKGAALKCDIEGAEYDAILKSPNETLRAFDQIMLEYHKGYLNLAKKLEDAGFAVETIGRPTYYNHPERGPTLRGMLIGTRID